jgi:ATP-dependent Clp protease ATP-binding subunit ClpA
VVYSLAELEEVQDERGRPGLMDLERQWKRHLNDLGSYLDGRILGQDNALARITRALQASELGLNGATNRPKCSFLFLGPTGVGKTESAKKFTEYLFGTRSALEILFMNEYSSEARFAEFIERTEQAVRRHPEGTTILFDEIEKAHPRVIDIFLSLLEEGQLTNLRGERTALRRFYLVLTSNLGSGDLAKMESAPYSTMERVALDVASQFLRPELFARITERIVFRPLDLGTQKRILEALIASKLLALESYFERPLTIDRGPVMALLLRSAYNRAQGARLLRQEVDRQFNYACLEWALRSEVPAEGLFRHDPTHARLVLE